MKRPTWIVLDFLLAAMVGILGKPVASYLQTRFDLTDPFRFIFVAAAFIVCLGLSLLITLKKHSKVTGAEVGEMTKKRIEVNQKIGTEGENGKAVGIEAQEVSGGSITANQTVDRVEKGGSVTGARIGKM